MVAEPTYTKWTSNAVASTAVSDNGCNATVKYQYCKATSNSTWSCSSSNISSWLSTTWTTFSSLTDGTKYYYFVRTQDGLWNTSVWSASTSSTQDNTAPVVALSGSGSPSYANSGTEITIYIKVTDTTAWINTWDFVIGDLSFTVSGASVTPSTKTLTYQSVSNGVYLYKLVLKWVTWNGALTVTSAASAVADKAWNNSASKTLTPSVTIDNINPSCSISASPTTPTSGNVTLTLAYVTETNQISAWYSWTWTTFNSTKTKTVSANGTYTWYVKDAAWNTWSCSITVNNIDKTAPAAPTCTANACYSGSKAVSCSTTSSDGTVRYSTSGTPTCSSTVWSDQSFSATTTLKVIACDPAWNASSVVTYTYTADNAAPNVPTMVDEPEYTQWLSNSVSSTVVTDAWCNGWVSYQFCVKQVANMRWWSDINNSLQTLSSEWPVEWIERTDEAPWSKAEPQELWEKKWEILARYDEKSRTIYIYSKNEIIKLPWDSSDMFANIKGLIRINLWNIDTSEVIDMSRMFAWNEDLTSLDLSKFDTSNVEDMTSMFEWDSKLKTIYASKKFTNKAKWEGMFLKCISLMWGNWTQYSEKRTDETYARIDSKGTPWYFTEWKVNTKDGGDLCEITSSWLSTPTTTFNNLEDGTKYYYFVRAKDNLWNTSEWSDGTNSTQDNTAPTISITNPNNSCATSKVVKATITDVTAWVSTMKYVKTWSSTCTWTTTNWGSAVDYPNNSNITLNVESDNGKYICFQAIDAVWNVSYERSSQITWIDVSGPWKPTWLTWQENNNQKPTLNWTAPSDNGCSNVAWYEIQVCSNNSCSSVVQSGAPTTTSWTATSNLTAWTIYTWRVRAKDALWNWWSWETWTVAVNSLTFNGTMNGGSTTATTQYRLSGSVITLSTSTYQATKDGWTFVWWNTSSTAKSAQSSITLNGNKTVYAIYKKVPTVTFNKNGASSVSPTSKTCEMWNTATSCTVTWSNITAPNNFVIRWWSTDQNAISGTIAIWWTISVSGDVTYYAIVHANPQISFVSSPTPNDWVTWTQNRFTTKMSITNIDKIIKLTYNYNGQPYDLASWLVLMYNFDNVASIWESTSLVKDLSQYWRDGIVHWATWTNNGVWWWAYQFNWTTSNYIDFPSYWALKTNWTISVWVKWNKTQNWLIIGNETWIALWFYNSQIIWNTQWLWSKPKWIISNYNDNWWNHIVVSINNWTMSYYINGKKLTNTGSTYWWWTNNGTWRIWMKNQSTYYPFNGMIDEVRVYNRALTQDEVQFLYKSNLKKTSADTWEFETLNTCLAATWTYRYSWYVESAVDTSWRTENRMLTTNIPLVSVDATGYDFGSRITSGSIQTINWTMWTLTVTDNLWNSWWLLYLATSDSLVWKNTAQTIDTNNLKFKANSLIYNWLYEWYTNTHVAFGNGISTTQYKTAKSSCAAWADHCASSSAKILEYMRRTTDTNDFICGDVWTYSDNTQIQLEIPAWQIQDTYEWTLRVTLQDEYWVRQRWTWATIN